MALWPFRRKSARRRPRNANAAEPEGVPRRTTAPVDMTAPTARVASQRKQRDDSVANSKLQRRTRTYSFSPGRSDNIRRGSKHDPVPPVPTRPAESDLAGVNGAGMDQDPSWQRAPTLHNRNPVPRRKSSKRRREDLDREAEIKAMSNSMPLRAATEDWNAGRPMKKDTKRARTIFGSGRHWEDEKSSDVSLPIPESIHSTMSSDSGHASYRISALEALAPRPTLRYSTRPSWGLSPNDSGLARTPSQKRRFTDREPIPEATLKAHKRVDDLADNLGAADLRELMDRDKRRRERKEQRDQERMEKRLARRAERQREAEAESRQKGTPPPQNLERGVLGRDTVGLGIDTTSAVVTSSKRRTSTDSIQQTPQDAKGPATTGLDKRSSAQQAYSHFHRTNSIPLPSPAAAKAPEVPMPATKPADTETSSTGAGAIRPKKTRSKSPLSPDDEKRAFSPFPSRTSDIGGSRKDSDVSSRGRLSFSSIFKWGQKTRRSSGPSSFSNTSREEMHAAPQSQPPTVAPAAAPIPIPTNGAGAVAAPARKLSSSMPKRTRSRFREDLPELPMSPPDSRGATPEVEAHVMLPAVTEATVDEIEGRNTAAAARYGTPTSDVAMGYAEDSVRPTPTSVRTSGQQPSPPPHSVSMASIDSEASWLSGRLAGKRSGLRGSISRQHHRTTSFSSSRVTDDELAEDEYLSNLAPPAREGHATSFDRRRSAGEARPSSDEDDAMDDDAAAAGDMKWGSVGARPKMAQSQTFHSSKGLLDEGEKRADDPEEKSGEKSADRTSEEMTDLETPQMQHARSVQLGRGHARHISAGSAKLLDLSPRNSLDVRSDSPANRRSTGFM